jgi:hypothetical protein
MNRLLLHITVVDGATGEIIFSYTPASKDIPELRSVWGFSLAGSGSDPATLRGIATGPVTNFVLNLIPHYQYEERELVW